MIVLSLGPSYLIVHPSAKTGWAVRYLSNMKKIELSRGLFTLVDDEDYDWLSQWKWYATTKKGNTHYAKSDGSKRKGLKKTSMHRLLMNAPKGRLVDHRDGDGLNNQKYNLWIPPGSGRTENALNRRELDPNNTSGISGVSWNRADKLWRAQISYKGKQICIGSFHTKEEAAMAVINYLP